MRLYDPIVSYIYILIIFYLAFTIDPSHIAFLQSSCLTFCQTRCAAAQLVCLDGKCFPSFATVQLKDGSIKMMQDLQIGDHVLTDANTYSEVYMFSHRDADSVASFVNVTTTKGELLLTPNHYLYVNGRLVVAGLVKKGDHVVDEAGNTLVVTNVTRVLAQGM
jgi:hypothetical protein